MLAQAPARLASMTSGITEVQLNTPPGPGEWSANEVLAHLRACADMWGKGIATIRSSVLWRHCAPTNEYADTSRVLSMTMLLRLARFEDLPAIVDIYNQSIPSKQSTGDLQPIRVEERLAWFQEHRAEKHPIFVADMDGQVTGWCSLSAYRQGRGAFRFTAEISYYIAPAYQRQGIGTALIAHTLAACPALGIRHLFAIVLETNTASLRLLERMGFEQWGYLPRVADFDGNEVGHLYYGRHL